MSVVGSWLLVMRAASVSCVGPWSVMSCPASREDGAKDKALAHSDGSNSDSNSNRAKEEGLNHGLENGKEENACKKLLFHVDRSYGN